MVPPDSCRVSPAPHYSGSVTPQSIVHLQDFHLLRFRFPDRFDSNSLKSRNVLQPRRILQHNGLGSCAFARHYSRNHCCFLFLRVLRCFSSPRSPPYLRMNIHSRGWVAPFGDPRINASLQLPVDYRSLARPSSPAYAKASTVRPFLLYLHDSHNANHTAS
jgi:hypothetical protein